MSDRIRIDEPGYVARYRASHADAAGARADQHDASEAAVHGEVPLYLRRYREDERGAAHVGTQTLDATVVVPFEGPAGDRTSAEIANDVFLVRHGEVDLLADDVGLTEQGAEQARAYGRRLAAQFRDGDAVVVGHAGSPRTRQTADLLAAALGEAAAAAGKRIAVEAPTAMSEFANFRFVGPDGPTDITDAFRNRHAAVDPAWQVDATEPPLWSFELDRFWNVQLGGGDPIALWLSTPSLHAEPPAMVVRRVWSGIRRLGDVHPGAHLVVATHAGCVRAFAVAALGYDPGEPYNTEHVRAKILAGRTDALVSYRNRFQEVCVPDIADLPVWRTIDNWQPPSRVAIKETAS